MPYHLAIAHRVDLMHYIPERQVRQVVFFIFSIPAQNAVGGRRPGGAPDIRKEARRCVWGVYLAWMARTNSLPDGPVPRLKSAPCPGGPPPPRLASPYCSFSLTSSTVSTRSGNTDPAPGRQTQYRDNRCAPNWSRWESPCPSPGGGYSPPPPAGFP